MRYTDNDIPTIPLREFLSALGEKPVKSTEHFNVYYPPYRDDSEPVFVVYHTQTSGMIMTPTRKET